MILCGRSRTISIVPAVVTVTPNVIVLVVRAVGPATVSTSTPSGVMKHCGQSRARAAVSKFQLCVKVIVVSVVSRYA